ncbi:pro-resilin-like [Maniola hyperantus]|uniref:pro-resilin-like n=1 Tax=Aphantopus hyperantus TaxID=2795564 RepID=UPI0015697955|nr:pro-resilin-like [Maniola hyperantus]
MWKIIYLTLVAWVSLKSFSSAQEYLPPKPTGGGGGGGIKKPIIEPTLPANYEFTYDVQDNGVSLDFGHNEKRKDDRAQGSYHVLLPDGRTQLVEYEAGPDGYRPQVMYMGTATYPTQTGGGGGGGGGDKFDGYHYNAASNRQSVRQTAPRGGRQAGTAPPPAPAPPLLYAAGNATQ